MNRRNLIKTGVLSLLATQVPSFGAGKLDHENYNYEVWCFVTYRIQHCSVYQCIYILENGEQLNRELLVKLSNILWDKVKVWFNRPEGLGQFTYDNVDFDNTFWHIAKIKKNAPPTRHCIDEEWPQEPESFIYSEFKKKFV